jgi:VWFA-related protein
MAIAVAATLHGQVFRSGVAMVALSVTVTDPQGQSVSGLTAEDFAVYEDGVRQTVTLFESDHVPLDVALVLDTSNSMGSMMPVVQAGARGLVSRLRDGDRVAVIDIKRQVRVHQDFTGNLDSIRTAIGALRPSGTTALYDGLYVSLRHLERERRLRPELRRQALVLFSDGFDTTSRLDFDDIAAVARAGDVAIYAITPDRPNRSRLKARREQRRLAFWEMRTLTRDTGGLAFFPWGAEERGAQRLDQASRHSGCAGGQHPSPPARWRTPGRSLPFAALGSGIRAGPVSAVTSLIRGLPRRRSQVAATGIPPGFAFGRLRATSPVSPRNA